VHGCHAEGYRELLVYMGAEMCITKIMFTKCVYFCCCIFVILRGPFIRLLQIEHACDNLQVITLVLFRLVLNSGGRSES
jgi:hypothetical protein